MRPDDAAPRAHRVVSTSFIVFAIKIFSAGLSLLLALLLTHLLAPAEYGRYARAAAVLTVLAVVVTLGIDRLVVREIAIHRSRDAHGGVRGILAWSSRVVFLSALVGGILTACVLLFAARLAHASVDFALLGALAILPAMAVGKLRQGILQGWNQPLQGELPELVIQPLLLLSFLAIIWVSPLPRTAVTVVAALFLASTCGNMAGAVLVWRHVRRVPEAPSWTTPRPWLTAAFPMLFVNGVNLLNAQLDVLVLGVLAAPRDVAVYAVAAQGASLLTIAYYAVQTVILAPIAELSARGDTEGMQRIVTRASRLTLGITAVVTVVFVAFSRFYLSLFGPEYPGGELTLILLAVTHLLAATAGPVGGLLVMTGRQKEYAWAVAIGAATNLACSPILVLRWGMVGAAIAAMLGVLATRFVAARAAKKHLGIETSPWRSLLTKKAA